MEKLEAKALVCHWRSGLPLTNHIVVSVRDEDSRCCYNICK